jgi:hypothetical protein
MAGSLVKASAFSRQGAKRAKKGKSIKLIFAVFAALRERDSASCLSQFGLFGETAGTDA